MSNQVGLFISRCIPSTLLASVIFLPLISSFHVTNEYRKINFNTTASQQNHQNEHNQTTEVSGYPALSSHQTITLFNQTKPSLNVTKLNATTDLIGDESALHTITVNSSSLFGDDETLSPLFQSDITTRTRRELEDDKDRPGKSNKSEIFIDSNKTRGIQRKVGQQEETSRGNSNYTLSDSGKSHNNKTQLDPKLRNDEKVSGKDDSKMSFRSLKFLKRIKSKRKLNRARAKSEEPANYTSSASYNYKNWIDLHGSPISSLSKRKRSKMNRLFQLKNQDHKVSSDATTIEEPKAVAHDQAVGVNQSDDNSASSNQNQAGDEHRAQINANEEAAGGIDPSHMQQQQQQHQQQPKLQLQNGGEQPLVEGLDFQVKREHYNTRESSKPLINKSVASTTTIDNGNEKAKLTSKSASLPPGLRQRIIEQFVKGGGDPHNIFVSDSTITTTSQSKKKTITTVYRIVPSNLKQKNIKPISIKEKISVEHNPSNFDFSAGKFNVPSSNFSSFLANQKGVDEAERENIVRNLINDDKRLPRKLKKIMVTRTEVPQTVFMSNKGDSILDNSEKKFINEENGDLGEFYQGPHETIFGLDEKPNEFSIAEKKNIMNLDKMVHNSSPSTSSQDEHEQVKYMMNVKTMNKHNGMNDDPSSELFKKQTTKGISGTGISLDVLMDAIKKPVKNKSSKVPSLNESLNAKHDADQTNGKLFDDSGSQESFGKNYQQQQSSKHLSNFHEVTNKDTHSKKATESGYSNQDEANDSKIDSETGSSSKRKSTDGATKSSNKAIKNSKLDDKFGGAKKKHPNQEDVSKQSDQESNKITKPTTSEQQTKDGSKFSTNLKSQKLDSLEELKRVVLASSSERLKGSSLDMNKKSFKLSGDETNIENGKNYNSPKPVDKNIETNSSEKSSSTPTQPVTQLQTNPASAIKTKTHNIMMLIDFGPLQQQQHQHQHQNQHGREKPADEGLQKTDELFKQFNKHQDLRLDKSASSGSKFVRSSSPAQSNRWRPVNPKSVEDSAHSLAPTVNVQIYNNHLEQQRSRDQQSESDEELDSPDQDETMNSLRQSSVFQHHNNNNYYNQQRAPVASLSNTDIESEFEGPMFDAGAASVIKPLKYQTPLPSFIGTTNPDKIVQNFATSPNYLRFGHNQQLPSLTFGALAPPRAISIESQLQRHVASTKAPILPGESASTNQLVEQVIGELAMAATNEQHGIGEHLYTTTSVRDPATSSKSSKGMKDGSIGVDHDDEDDVDDDDDDDGDQHFLHTTQLNQLNDDQISQQLNSQASNQVAQSSRLDFEKRSEVNHA